MTKRHRSRRLVALVLAAVALSAAAAVSQARKRGDRVRDLAVEIGMEPTRPLDPGNADPFEPFTFAVIGAPRGSHAALGRAVREIEQRGGVSFAVILGDVAGDDPEIGYPRMSDVLCRLRAPAMALPGPTDAGAAGLEGFQCHISAPRWYFVHRGCSFTGVTGARPDDGDFRAGGEAAMGDVLHAFSFDLSVVDREPSATLFDSWRMRDSEDGEMVVELVYVADRVRTERFTVSRAASVGSLTRDLEFGVLYPIVGGSTAAFVAALVACAALLGGSVVLARRP